MQKCTIAFKNTVATGEKVIFVLSGLWIFTELFRIPSIQKREKSADSGIVKTIQYPVVQSFELLKALP